MKLTVLVDNNTIIDRYFCGEPGVSYYLECDGHKYLFDTGYSDIFRQNAGKLHLDLLGVEAVILSHGHNDHTWGLGELVKLFSEANFAGYYCKTPSIIAHPDAFLPKNSDGLNVGALLTVDQLSRSFAVKLSQAPLWLTENLVFLGEIERNNSFEANSSVGTTLRQGTWEADFVLDDSALAYRSKKGLVIITGCSHAGICNIIEYAKKVCHEERVYEVIGGFHLLNASFPTLRHTADYFERCRPHAVYACHCTDLEAKISLARVVKLAEVGVGLVLEYQ